MPITGRFEADFSAFTAAVQNAAVTLTSFEANSNKVESSLSKMTNAFSGTKLIQDATLMAAAVEHVGGVSQLTQAELAKVSAKAAEAAEKMRALGMAVPESISQLASASTGMVSQLEAGSVSLGKLIAGFVSAEAILGLLKVGFDKLTDAAKAFFDVIMKGSEVAAIEENFQRLTAQAGLLSDTLIGELQTATQGTIDKLTLMKTVNQDLAAGMRLTQDQFRTLAEGAFRLAQATGVNMKEAFDAMNDAMLNGRTMALGHIVNLEALKDAEDKYGAAMVKSGEQLTEAGKLEARRLAVLQTVGEQIKLLGDQTLGLADRAQQAEVAWADFETDLGKTIATSQVLAALLDGLKQIVIETFGGTPQAAIKRIAELVDEVAIASVSAVEVVVNFGVALVKSFELGEKAWQRVVQGFDLVAAAGTAAANMLLHVIELSEQAVGASGAAAATRAALAANVLEQERWGKAIADAQIKIDALNVAQSAADTFAQKWRDTLDDLKGKMEAAKDSSDKLATGTDAVSRALAAAGERARQHTIALTQLSDAQKRANEAIEKAWGDLGALQLGHEAMTTTVFLEVIQWIKLGAAQNDIAVAYKLSAETVKQLAGELDKAAIVEKNRLAVVNAAIVAELEARIKLNEAMGLDAQGRLLEATAIERLQRAIDELNKTKVEGVPIDAQLQVLSQDYTKQLYEQAIAEDAAAQARAHGNTELAKTPALIGGVTQAQTQLRQTADSTTAALQKQQTLMNSFIGNSFPSSESLTRAGLNPGSFLGLPPPPMAASLPGGAMQGPIGLYGSPVTQPASYADELNAYLQSLSRTILGVKPRAAGGPVGAGSPYLVGEKGPELFVPSSSGAIVPNSGGAVNVTINVSGILDPATADLLASKVGQVIVQRTGLKLGRA